MEVKYYTINICDKNKSRMERRRKRILRKRIRCACYAVELLSIFYLMYINILFDQNMIATNNAVINSIITLVIMFASVVISENTR